MILERQLPADHSQKVNVLIVGMMVRVRGGYPSGIRSFIQPLRPAISKQKMEQLHMALDPFHGYSTRQPVPSSQSRSYRAGLDGVLPKSTVMAIHTFGEVQVYFRELYISAPLFSVAIYL